MRLPFPRIGSPCPCGRATHGPLCSGCLDRLLIIQSACACPTSTRVAQAVGGEGERVTLPAIPFSKLCRGFARTRYVEQGYFLPKLTGGASRSAGLFGGPVLSFIRLFLSSMFVAERKGARKWGAKVDLILVNFYLKLVNSCALETACQRH